MTTVTVTKPVPQETFLQRLGDAIKGFWTHEVAPFLLNLWSFIQMDVIAQIKPLAEAELAKLDQGLLTGGVQGFLQVFNATFAGTLQAVEGAGIQASVHDVITTVQGVLAAKTATAKVA